VLTLLGLIFPGSAAFCAEDEPWDVTVPHAPGDTLRFETAEGTWMTVDVSPDGGTLLFDLLGDLYTMPVEGGRAKRLTAGLAYDMQPRWSPDGRRIAFTSDRGGTENVWIVGADGSSARPLSEEPDRVTNTPAWSPDGEWIAARRRLTDRSSLGTVELWLYNVRGGKGVQITKKDEIPDASEPAFSRDGRYIYFSARDARYQYDRNVYAGIWQIRRYDLHLGKVIALTDGAGGSGRPEISPDGRTMSFVRRVREKTVLYLYDLASGRERPLFDGCAPDQQEAFAWTGVYPAYAWTPDGKSLVLYAGGGFVRVDAATGRAQPIQFTAPVEQLVAHAVRFPHVFEDDSLSVRQIAWPSLSPDRRTMAFSALGEVWAYDLATRRARVLSPRGTRAFAPAWSPDGKWIAYVSWRDVAGGHLCKVPAKGGAPVELTTVPSQYLNPAWSRDGSKLCFLRGSGGPLRDGHDLNDELWLELQWIASTGGGAHTVTTLPSPGDIASVPRPVWSAAGDRIYYNEPGKLEDDGATEKNALVSIRPDGTDAVQHAVLPNAQEMIPSPDERWVAYRVKYNVFVACLPRIGRTPVELGPDGALPVRQLTEDGGDWLAWTTDGRSLTWSTGPEFRTLALDSLLAAWDRSRAEAGRPKTPAAKDSTGAEEKAKTEAKKDAGPKADSLHVRLRVPRARPEGTAAFVGARVITESPDRAGEVIENATVIVTRNRISAVGPRASTPVPAGARVFDATGLTLLPGFIDAHAHCHYTQQGVVPDSFWAYRANLAYGVTTMLDPSATSYEVFTQAEMVEAGAMTGPRVFSTGNILYGAGGGDALPLKSLEEARAHVRRMKRLGANSVKSYMQPRREQRQWILEAAREESLLVFPEGGGKFEENLGMVMDGHTGIEHSLPVQPIYNDVVTLFARSRSGWTPTLLVTYGGLSGEHYFYQHADVFDDPKLRRFVPQPRLDARAIRRAVMAPDWDWHHMAVAEGARKVVEAGGHVQLGAHGQLQGLGAHWELWSLTQGGMKAADALRCATWTGAWYLGMDRDLGSIEPGKLADFILLEKNPLDDIRNSTAIRWTVKNGEVYDAETLARLR
jgi:Tol biopolymer transport system component/imidazolonepropionase-like amidohydrolase